MIKININKNKFLIKKIISSNNNNNNNNNNDLINLNRFHLAII